jgi:hypothetical protein
MYSSDRWRHVTAGFGTFQQRAQIVIQVPRILFGCLPVYASGSVLARALIRLAQPVSVDVVGSSHIFA